MIIIQTVSEKYFKYNGIQYAKIYQPLQQGLEDIGIYSIYDTRLQLQNSQKYNQYQIDGTVYATQALTIAALLPVIYASPASGVIIVIIGAFRFVLFKHDDNDVDNNFVEYKDIIMGYWGQHFYKLRFDTLGGDNTIFQNYKILERNKLTP